MSSRIVLVDDELFDKHRAPNPHPERPERLAAARSAVEAVATRVPLRRLAARDASPDELVRVHTQPYVEHLGQVAGQAGAFDADTFRSEASVAAALRAAGGALSITDRLLADDAQLGVGLLRPPGHHARPSAAMGFCLVNNVAVAAAHALQHGASRVAIIDWDVHHGNGTEEMFYADPRVLYVSLHQSPFYPGTGHAEDLGTGEGLGYNVNVPLSAGATSAVYTRAFARIVAPIVESYAPDLTFISAGFDAHRADPLGGMELDDTAYPAMLESLIDALLHVSDQPRLALLLEGGYSLRALEASLKATLEKAEARLCGGPEPANRGASASPHPGISPRHEHELARAVHAQAQHWKLG
jgi:acetoin utilization deacetylase AcuC-like enzyme